MKAVVLDGGTLGFEKKDWEALGTICEFSFYEKTNPSDVLERATDATALFTNKVVFSEEILNQLPHVKYIGELATGVDNIALPTCHEKGICVTNVPAYSDPSVAQHVMALILSITNRIAEHNHSVKKGAWENSKYFSYWLSELRELSGKTLGLVGYGRIAKAVTKLAHAFGMTVQVYTPRPKIDETVSFVSLETLFKESDIVSLHCPLTDETKDLINRDRLSQMKPSAILINTGRGGLVDETALSQALHEGEIAFACIDVLKNEPPFKDNPLISLDNCIITPHIAWATVEARKRLLGIAIDNFSAFISGEKRNRV